MPVTQCEHATTAPQYCQDQLLMGGSPPKQNSSIVSDYVARHCFLFKFSGRLPAPLVILACNGRWR